MRNKPGLIPNKFGYNLTYKLLDSRIITV